MSISSCVTWGGSNNKGVKGIQAFRENDISSSWPHLIVMEIYDKGWHFPPRSTPKCIGCWQTLISYVTECFSSFFFPSKKIFIFFGYSWNIQGFSNAMLFLLILSVWPAKNKRTKFYCSKLQTVLELSSFEEKCNPRFTLCP